ncbi:Uncharacterized protein Adt_41209 [Abeliophyllum distichum]|uniref:Retrotransposon protein n=1 Tax=Abeliophyllum distichum TaxID=126358 RepID=A0ABD1PN75_9LAMI
MVMTLTDRIGVMEEKMEEMHQGVKLSMETMKTEIQGQMETLMERFNWMADKLEEQERGRKGKEGEGTKRTELPISSENSPGIKTRSREIEGGGGFDGGWRPDHRSRRLEMPVFEGLDPDRWIYKAKRYFAINQIADEERMEATVVCLDGEALAWFQWEKKPRKLHSWEELKVRMLERF